MHEVLQSHHMATLFTGFMSKQTSRCNKMKIHIKLISAWIRRNILFKLNMILQWPLVVKMKNITQSVPAPWWFRLTFFEQHSSLCYTKPSRWPWWWWACCSHPTDSNQNVSQVHRPLRRSANVCSHTNLHLHSSTCCRGQRMTWRSACPVWVKKIQSICDQCLKQWCRGKWEFWWWSSQGKQIRTNKTELYFQNFFLIF